MKTKKLLAALLGLSLSVSMLASCSAPGGGASTPPTGSASPSASAPP